MCRSLTTSTVLLLCFFAGCRSIQTEAEIGSLHGVKMAVATGANVNSKTFVWQRSALHQAATNGHTDVVAYLISKEADVNIRSEGGDVPLHRAARNGHIKVMKLLIDNGTDLTQHGTGCGTPLQWAARADQLRAAQLLIDAGADVDNQGSRPLYGPLRDAIRNDNPMMVELLLENGANVDAVVGGNSSLHLAYGRRNVEIAGILLRYDANPELEYKGKKVPSIFLKGLAEESNKIQR